MDLLEAATKLGVRSELDLSAAIEDFHRWGGGGSFSMAQPSLELLVLRHAKNHKMVDPLAGYSLRIEIEEDVDGIERNTVIVTSPHQCLVKRTGRRKQARDNANTHLDQFNCLLDDLVDEFSFLRQGEHIFVRLVGYGKHSLSARSPSPELRWVTFGYGIHHWTTIGVHENGQLAFWRAIRDGFRYLLWGMVEGVEIPTIETAVST
ncbi:hypothetical protein CL634_08965 [bacterium]|nr:hypothetical protein [bacterium]|tara:strand:+ start:607 stop:1224 length:618 start_codon:yes stop_codon:yes gene_type:complete